VRDRARETVNSQLKDVLGRYYLQNKRYPVSLSELVPAYINYVPVDPKTNNPYGYSILDGGAMYSLCIYFETKSPSAGCLNSEVINAERMGIPVPSMSPEP
jgi:hypothetical protein